MSTKLNHTQLIEAVAEESGYGDDVVGAVLRATFDVIGKTVIAKGRVTVTNFGSFFASKVAPTVRRNPATGEEWRDSAHFYPRFRWSPMVRRATVAGGAPATLRKRGKGQA